jgi:hypothetical protein
VLSESFKELGLDVYRYSVSDIVYRHYRRLGLGSSDPTAHEIDMGSISVGYCSIPLQLHKSTLEHEGSLGR